MNGVRGKRDVKEPVQFHVESFRVRLPIEVDVIGAVVIVSSWVVVTGVVESFTS